MIKTRFDNPEVWETKREAYEISEMETSHIINLLRMFKTKPTVILNILLESVEDSSFAFSKHKNKAAINEITSMSNEELIEVAMDSVLVAALCDQLEERGVNVENILNNISTENEKEKNND